MTWAQAVRTAAARLAQAGVPSPLPDARALAAHVRAIPTSLAVSAESVTPPELAQFQRLLERRIRREPLQHILGKMWFRYLELEARPGVFIVRPETEMLAQVGIDFLQAQLSSPAFQTAPFAEPLLAVDLFSGSGAIALSMASELGAARQESPLAVFGVEKSPFAYDSELRNNHRYGDLVTFIHADALAPLPAPFEERLAGHTMLVIANPPYVPPNHQLSPEVQADPPAALFGGGAAGLDIPLATIMRARALLAPGGALLMEHASEQAAPLRAAAQEAGFIAVTTGHDLTGAARWLSARWPA